MASILVVHLAQPVLAQSVASVAAAKGAASDTPVTLTGSIDWLPSGEHRDATVDVRLDMADYVAPQQNLEADGEVMIVGRVDRTFAPSDEFDDRAPVAVRVAVERLEVAE